MISSFFADIHRQNELNNFVLPVTVDPAFLQELLDSIAADPLTRVRVDVGNQTVTNLATGRTATFPLDAYKKYCLMNGLDDIDYLLAHKKEIEAYEIQHR